MRKIIFSSIVAIALGATSALAQVTLKENQLHLDGVPQPQLFGAELQYFRLRGGYGKNIPRAKVLALWNQALDRMVEAKMNTVSFYIPWDFHEYAEGKFDFTGTADEDHDGQPDYPSRDIVTFFKLVENHGIHRILVRPGPYINAEWGFLGFGAIPEWFHEKYPNSHMQTPWGWKTSLYDYHNPDLLRHTQLWFEALYKQVLKDKIGPHKPIVFLQLDNETNFQWQSIYNHDYSPSSVTRYQEFLKSHYPDLNSLNQAHHRDWQQWTSVQPPHQAGVNVAEDQDWYQFADASMYSYLVKIRQLWERLGVSEPQVLFSLAESYNAVENGVLPNFQYRNARDLTGMMTVNLYPKTDESQHPFLNSPFKADLDVKSADAANDAYFGSRQEWVLGPEIQAGWWRGTEVSPEARLQTYLTVIGHGLKALYVYYFNEGQNYGVDWGYKQAKPLFEALRKEWKLETTPVSELSNGFWGELQARTDRLVVVGIDVRKILQRDPLANEDLYFDAPLDGTAKPRAHFFQLKSIGEKLIAPYQSFLARSVEVEDPVALVKDSTEHQPSALPRVSGLKASSDWAAGMLGSLMTADANPSVLHGEISPESDFKDKVLIHIDTGRNSSRTLAQLQKAFAQHQMIVNFLASSVPDFLGLAIKSLPVSDTGTPSELTYYLDSADHLVSGLQPDARPVHFQTESHPSFTYSLNPETPTGCAGILYWGPQIVGYQCQTPAMNFVQVGSDFFKDLNTGNYGSQLDAHPQRMFFKALFTAAGVRPKLELSRDAKFTVAFARRDPKRRLLWITVKTGAMSAQALKLKVNADLLRLAVPVSANYQVRNPLAGSLETIPAETLTTEGFSVALKAKDSTVYIIEPAPKL